MKVKTLCVACALLLMGSTASAFQVEKMGMSYLFLKVMKFNLNILKK